MWIETYKATSKLRIKLNYKIESQKYKKLLAKFKLLRRGHSCQILDPILEDLFPKIWGTPSLKPIFSSQYTHW